MDASNNKDGQVHWSKKGYLLEDDLRFKVLFNSISVLSGQKFGDKERLCAMELCLRLEKFPPQAGLELRTARSVGMELQGFRLIIGVLFQIQIKKKA